MPGTGNVASFPGLMVVMDLRRESHTAILLNQSNPYLLNTYPYLTSEV